MSEINEDRAWHRLKELQGSGVVGYMGWCVRDDQIVFQFRFPAGSEDWVGSLLERTAPVPEFESLADVLADLHCEALSHIAQSESFDRKDRASIEAVIAYTQGERRRRQTQILRVAELSKIAAEVENPPERGLPKFRPLPQYVGLSPDGEQWSLFNVVHPKWVELGWTIWDLDGDDDWPAPREDD